MKDLTEEELGKIREELDKYTIEGDLRREVSLNIRNLKEIEIVIEALDIRGVYLLEDKTPKTMPEQEKLDTRRRYGSKIKQNIC